MRRGSGVGWGGKGAAKGQGWKWGFKSVYMCVVVVVVGGVEVCLLSGLKGWEGKRGHASVQPSTGARNN